MALKYEDVIAKYEPVLGLEVHVERYRVQDVLRL